MHTNLSKFPENFYLKHHIFDVDFQFYFIHPIGCEDSVVRIWRVPEEGLLETMSVPAAELTGKI